MAPAKSTKRPGRDQEAELQLQSALEADDTTRGSPAYLSYFLAMSEYQRGNLDTARMSLQSANELCDAEFAKNPHTDRKAILELLRKETQELIGTVSE